MCSVRLIERPVVVFRPLGSPTPSESTTGRSSLFNGNNCRVNGDMNRRVIIAELDARMEKPAERAFAADPVAMVLADRGQYIAACMTILRAYIAAGSAEAARGADEQLRRMVRYDPERPDLAWPCRSVSDD